MFDYHIHSRVSYDSKAVPEEIVKKAVESGLKEICFTDHLDYGKSFTGEPLVFDTEIYNKNYDHLSSKDLKIRRGFEFGMTPFNRETLIKDLRRRHFDFVIGSVHFVEEEDVFFEPYWDGKSQREGEFKYFEEILHSVKVHDDFDVLGHITYVGKVKINPYKRIIPYREYGDIFDEIFRVLISKGKGIEVNTSGLDRCGDYLPGAEYLRRFKELGGQIVTVGSDAHQAERVGQYCFDACKLVQEIFGYVCTFENRKPIFHKG